MLQDSNEKEAFFEYTRQENGTVFLQSQTDFGSRLLSLCVDLLLIRVISMLWSSWEKGTQYKKVAVS